MTTIELMVPNIFQTLFNFYDRFETYIGSDDRPAEVQSFFDTRLMLISYLTSRDALTSQLVEGDPKMIPQLKELEAFHSNTFGKKLPLFQTQSANNGMVA